MTLRTLPLTLLCLSLAGFGCTRRTSNPDPTSQTIRQAAGHKTDDSPSHETDKDKHEAPTSENDRKSRDDNPHEPNLPLFEDRPTSPPKIALWPRTGPDPSQCAPPIEPNTPKVFYVCDCAAGADPDCQPGSDGNPGTAQAPLRSALAGARLSSWQTDGGTIAFCRGGSWRAGELGVFPSTKGSPTRSFADYRAPWNSGDESNPLIKLIEPGSALLFSINPGPQGSWGGLEFRNLRLQGLNDEGAGFLIFQDVSDIRLSCMDISHFGAGILALTRGENVVVEDSNLHHNGSAGWLGGCDDCGLRRCLITDNGGALAAKGQGSFGHNVYFSAGDEHTRSSTGLFLTNSYVTRSAVDPRTERCTGTSIVAHGGRLTNLTITDNIIEEPKDKADFGCWGLTVDSAASGYEENRSVKVARNVVRNMGNLSIGFSSCIDCVAESNVIIQQSIGGAVGIAMPNRQRQAEDAASTRFTARNNTVYYSDGGSGVGVLVGGEGTEHTVVNNLVHHDRPDKGACFEFGLPADAYGLVRANQCSGGSFEQGTDGLDSMAITAKATFMDAPEDLRPTSRSPAVDSGWASASRDCRGQNRDKRPDRGAYERIDEDGPDRERDDDDGDDEHRAPAPGNDRELASGSTGEPPPITAPPPTTQIRPRPRLFGDHAAAPPTVALWPRTGPDPAQCAAPIEPNVADVIYVCDCAAGADADCQAGSDGNSGSAQAPLRTALAAARRFEQQTNASAVAFCRGGSWQSGELYIMPSPRGSKTRTFADYRAPWNSGDELAPLIKLITPGSALLFSINPGPQGSWGGLEFRNLRLQGLNDEGAGFLLFQDVSDIRLSCMDISHFGAGFMALTRGRNVVIEDSVIHHNGSLGWLGGCDNCGLRRCSITDNGGPLAAQGQGSFAHNVYFAAGDENTRSSDGLFLTNSYITRSAVDPKTQRCMGSSVIAHGGRLANIRITDNIIEEPKGKADLGCWGLTVDSAASGYEENRNVLVARNVVRNMGNLAIGFSSCIDCVAESNVIIQQSIGGSVGIAMPNRQRLDEDAASTRFTARNNTVFYSEAGSGLGILVGGEGTEHSVVNNLVHHDRRGNGPCFEFGLPASAYGLVRANQCSGGTFHRGTGGLDSMAITAAASFEGAPEDLRPSAQSPAVDSGWAPNAPRDCRGRNRGKKPDRGAYER